MSKTNAQIFEPLQKLILLQNIEMHDIFDMLGGYFAETPAIGLAMNFHGRDICKETPDIKPPELLVSMIWRTFLCPENAPKYSTDMFIKGGSELIQSYVDYMIASMEMDTKQNAPASVIPNAMSIN